MMSHLGDADITSWSRYLSPAVWNPDCESDKQPVPNQQPAILLSWSGQAWRFRCMHLYWSCLLYYCFIIVFINGYYSVKCDYNIYPNGPSDEDPELIVDKLHIMYVPHGYSLTSSLETLQVVKIGLWYPVLHLSTSSLFVFIHPSICPARHQLLHAPIHSFIHPPILYNVIIIVRFVVNVWLYFF